VIVDASAIVAILFREPGHQSLIDSLVRNAPAGIAAPTLLEVGIVASARLKHDASSLVRNLLRELEVEVVPFGEEHAGTAHSAWLRYGKGRHPAALNFGDCISYAVAKRTGSTLLYVGSDFDKTDIEPA
jgi:ribonuclease VapC